MAGNLPLFEHNSNDQLWEGPDERRCPGCELIKPLAMFSDGQSDPMQTNMVTWLCGQCRQQDHTLVVAEKKEDSRIALAKTAEMLGAALKKKVGLAIIAEAAPNPVKGMRRAVEKMGGEDKAFDLIGRTFCEALDVMPDPKTVESRAKTAKHLFELILQTKKLEGEPPDLDQLGDEQMFQLSMSAAKFMIQNDHDFRRELLTDPEVRNLLLEDAGYEVIESDCEVSA